MTRPTGMTNPYQDLTMTLPTTTYHRRPNFMPALCRVEGQCWKSRYHAASLPRRHLPHFLLIVTSPYSFPKYYNKYVVSTE